MKKKIKKLCAGLLCAALALTLTTPVTKGLMKPEVTVNAADEQCDGEFVYKDRTFSFVYYGTGIRVLSVKEDGGELEIPSEVTIRGVKSKVISIGKYFGWFQKFRMVKIPNTVTRIEDKVFMWAIIEKIVLSDNLEQIGNSFCWGATISKLECNSKKIRKIGPYALRDALCPDFMVISNWVVKYVFPKNSTVIDLTSKEFAGVDCAAYGVFCNTDMKYTIKLSSKYVDSLNVLSGCDLSNVKYIEVDGKDVKCNKANDTLPDVIGKNYSVIADTQFAMTYFDKKARLLLEALGLNYYGPYNNKVGKLSAEEEYNICKTIHDYIVKNYTYDSKKSTFRYFEVFSNHSYTVCQTDAGMFAYLAECAGVDAEICYNGSNGKHCWNVVTVGGQKYYIDTTWDRSIDTYRWFLCSNKTMASDNNDNHANIKYCNYATGNWDRRRDYYANRNLCGKEVVECRITHGDLNMDNEGGVEEDDSVYLNAYIRMLDDLKKKCLEAKDGVVSLSDSEFNELNSIIPYKYVDGVKIKDGKILLGSLIMKGKVRLLFDPTVADINFDGKVGAQDIVALMGKREKPLDNKKPVMDGKYVIEGLYK